MLVLHPQRGEGDAAGDAEPSERRQPRHRRFRAPSPCAPPARMLLIAASGRASRGRVVIVRDRRRALRRDLPDESATPAPPADAEEVAFSLRRGEDVEHLRREPRSGRRRTSAHARTYRATMSTITGQTRAGRLAHPVLEVVRVVARDQPAVVDGHAGTGAAASAPGRRRGSSAGGPHQRRLQPLCASFEQAVQLAGVGAARVVPVDAPRPSQQALDAAAGDRARRTTTGRWRSLSWMRARRSSRSSSCTSHFETTTIVAQPALRASSAT